MNAPFPGRPSKAKMVPERSQTCGPPPAEPRLPFLPRTHASTNLGLLHDSDRPLKKGTHLNYEPPPQTHALSCVGSTARGPVQHSLVRSTPPLCVYVCPIIFLTPTLGLPHAPNGGPGAGGPRSPAATASHGRPLTCLRPDNAAAASAGARTGAPTLPPRPIWCVSSG